MAIFTITNLTVSALALYLAHRIYYESTTGRRRRALIVRYGCLPPTPRTSALPWYIPTLGLDFIIGNYRALKAKQFLVHWHDELQRSQLNTIVACVPGQQIFITRDPENVKAMLATDFEKWSLGRERIAQMSSYLGHGIFTNEGQAWRHSRDLVRPCFEKSYVADISLFERHVAKLLGLLSIDGQDVDLQPLFHKLSLDIATEFLFGRSVNSLGEELEEVKRFVEAFEYCANPFASEAVERWGFLGLFLPDRKRRRCEGVIRDFADSLIASELQYRSVRSSASKDTRYIFLDHLLAQSAPPPTIRAELLNILLAGRDTTAALLSNLFWELPRHPKHLSALLHEIHDTLGPDAGDGVRPTYEQLKSMRTLRAIISESQRLHPIVPTNSREALQDTVLPRGGGPDGSAPVLVPRGAYVAFHTWSLHRLPQFHATQSSRIDTDVGVNEDIDVDQGVESFYPLRWLHPSHRPGWSYIPFSGGPRVCVGQNFALTMVGYVVVRLLGALEVEPRGEAVWREKLSATCVGDGGCVVGLRRREGQVMEGERG